MALLVLLNNFMHDFSAAAWLSGAFLIKLLPRPAEDSGVAGEIYTQYLRIVRQLMRMSLAGIVVFGVIRALAYRAYEWSPAAGRGQIGLLAVKHVIFAVAFSVGIILYIKSSGYIQNARKKN